MRIHTHIDDISFTRPVVAVGAFDGVHLGHQVVIEKVKEKAREYGGESVVITFHPHPRVFLNSGNYSFKLLSTHLDKVDRFYKAEIDHLVVLPFDRALAQLSGEDFIKQMLVERIGVYHLVLGYDNHFGSDQLHNDSVIRLMGARYGFTLERLHHYKHHGKVVSSSIIRDKLNTGNIGQANKLLGYEYFVFGRVTYGNQIGKKIGFPTANIEIKDGHKMIPCNGVYIVKVNWNGTIYFGMCNIGIRPTINKSSFSIEVHLFNFSRDIYNDYITVFFLERIRDEKRFQSLDELTSQLEKDSKEAKEFLSVYQPTTA